jgi:predicted exporter
VFDKYASRLYDFTERKKRPVLFVLIFLIFVSLSALYFVEYESSMDNILPQNEVIGRSMEFFRNSNIAGKVIVSMELISQEKDINDLLKEVDLLAGSLDKNLFPEVTAGIPESEFAGDIDVMFKNLPEMISGEELSQIDSWINQERISQKLHDAYLQLLKPQGMLLSSMFRSDPLGMRMLVLEKLKSLSSSTGYNVEIKNGHFVSRDGRHSMLIAKSAVSVTDSAGSKKLLASLKKSLETLPGYIRADIICGHTHTVSNEKLIKGDIVFISIIAAVAMLLLYGFVIRDVSAITIFMIPVVSILFSIVLSYLLLGKLSYWVIGLGSTVAGIATDYGTHVYFAAQGKSDPSPFVKHVIKPVSFGALATIAIFIAFFFSGIKGYNQLAVVSIISIILSTLISIFVLPHLMLKPSGKASFADRIAEKLERGNLSSGLAVLFWIFFTLALSYFAVHVEFERDIRNIDGTEKEIINAEERFHKTWGGEKTLAVLVVNSKDYESALEMNERIYRDSVQAIGAENFTSVSALLPSEKTRKQNSEQWDKFWSEEREQKLQGLLSEEGKKYGFSKIAFDPFFNDLKVDHFDNTPLTPLDRGEVSPPLKKGDVGGFSDGSDSGLFERFVQKTNGSYRLVSFFPDTKEYVDSINEISRRYPGTYLVSASVLSSTLSEVVSADLKLMTWIAAISVIVMTYLCFFNIRETLIALVPPLTSIIWLFGLMSLLGLSINAANMIAGVLVIGLNSDYGLFMTFRSRKEMNTGTITAITLCTVTTLIGAGVLIFAKHPALSSVGNTMVIGLGAGFFSSVMVVPKLCELTVKAKKVKTS